MLNDSFLPQLLVLGTAAVLAAMLYGLAALWVAVGRAGPIARIAPIAILLAALAPIGAYELEALYAAQTIVVVGVTWIAPLGGRVWTARRRNDETIVGAIRTATREIWGSGPRFGIYGFFKAILLIATLFAILHYAALDPPDLVVWRAPLDVWPWLAVGATLGVLTIAATWTVFSSARWYLRVIPFLLLTLVGGIVAESLAKPMGFLEAYFTFNPDALVGWNFATTSVFAFTLTAWLTVARVAGVFPVPHPEDSATEHEPPSFAAPSWFRRMTRGCLGVATLAGISVLGFVYWQLLTPERPTITLPSPNGYDRVSQVGAALNWNAIPNEDYEAADLAACYTFVQDNVLLLATLREAVLLPSAVRLEFDPAKFPSVDVGAFRSVTRALCTDAKLAEGGGRHSDAASSYVDVVRLGPLIGNGGIAVDDMIADAIMEVGLLGLAAELPNLDAATLKSLGQSLNELGNARESLDAVLQRDRLWERLSFGWQGRLFFWSDHLFERTDGIHLPAKRARVREDAHLRLILAEAAVRRYLLEHGAPPDSLAKLVPEYLSAVPDDPYGDGPLMYRRTNDGYLLYSVGGNGTDDGGRRATYFEATTEGKGDLFFDASEEMPQAAAPASP